MSKQVLAACGAVLLGLVPLSASAHHGWGGQSDQVTEMTGTVVASVSLAGPHATMKINAGGHVWDLTLAPPARTSSAGLKDGAIPVGQTVTVRGNRNLDPNKFEMKTVQVRWGDKTFDVYPGRG